VEAVVRLSLDVVEREIGRLWEAEAQRSPAPRIELLTLVALVSERGLLQRARDVVAQVVRTFPSRSILVTWKDGSESTLTADARLHYLSAGGLACGDAIEVEAISGGRKWLPENIDRLTLPDLPVCLWWVGDLPDFDDLFDRSVVSSDLVIVNSSEMDLRDLEKLSNIVSRSRGRYAVTDLTWSRLKSLQELVARFFDDVEARDFLSKIERVAIEFAPREAELDVASTQAALFFGWIAQAMSLRPDGVSWKRGPDWGEATLGKVTVRFDHRPRADVVAGGVTKVTMEGGGARFEVERLEDPLVLRWSREVPGSQTAPQMLRVSTLEESMLMVRCLGRPRRDALFEKSLHVGSRIVRPVAPRFSTPPNR
jgi:glucose-6-phosphate dehydrogenase assembly protein OpcA